MIQALELRGSRAPRDRSSCNTSNTRDRIRSVQSPRRPPPFRLPAMRCIRRFGSRCDGIGIGSNTGSSQCSKTFAAAKPRRQSDVAGNDGSNRQHHQRNRHRLRRFVNVMLGVMIDSRFAVERHEQQAEHVERRHSRHARADQPQQDVSVRAGKCLPQDFILREEACQTRRSRNRQRSDGHRPERDRNLVPQRAHLPHVLLVMHRVDHAARSEEQAEP